MQHNGGLTGLSSELGQRARTNSEQLLVMTRPYDQWKREVEKTHIMPGAVAITSGVRPDAMTSIEPVTRFAWYEKGPLMRAVSGSAGRKGSALPFPLECWESGWTTFQSRRDQSDALQTDTETHTESSWLQSWRGGRRPLVSVNLDYSVSIGTRNAPSTHHNWRRHIRPRLEKVGLDWVNFRCFVARTLPFLARRTLTTQYERTSVGTG